MKKILKKVISGVMTIIMMMSFVGTITASATSLSIAPGSKFTYKVSVTKEGDKRLKVSFTSTKNPGVHILGVCVAYDKYCTPDLSATTSQCINGTGDNQVNTSLRQVLHTELAFNDYTGTVTLNYYFDLSESVSKRNHSFKVGVYDYASLTEGIAETTSNIPSESTATTKPYTLGDIDNDGVIEITDANDALNIANINGTGSVTVSNFNTMLTSNASVIMKYPNMVCAEVADVNTDKKITQTDAQKILEYYSSKAAGTSIVSAVGSSRIKTVVI